MALACFVADHERALTHDFRAEYGISIDDVGEAYSWGETDRLIESLKREQGSHLFADLRGWAYSMTRAEHLLVGLYNAFAVVNHNKKSGQAAPKWPTPFDGDTAPESPDDIDDDEARRILSATLGRDIN